VFELILAAILGNLLTIVPATWLAIYFKDDIKKKLFSESLEESTEEIEDMMAGMAESLGGQFGNQVENVIDSSDSRGDK